MRGKAPQGVPHGADFGITPAYAGKRAVPDDEKQDHKDHPRLCGEKHRKNCKPLSISGSPPPMRGKAAETAAAMRFIKDHPRLCGEKTHTKRSRKEIKGSPPPMRGKEEIRHTHVQNLRITPAYAGKRKWKLHSMLDSQDHPRLCGEK